MKEVVNGRLKLFFKCCCLVFAGTWLIVLSVLAIIFMGTSLSLVWGLWGTAELGSAADWVAGIGSLAAVLIAANGYLISEKNRRNQFDLALLKDELKKLSISLDDMAVPWHVPWGVEGWLRAMPLT